MKKLGLKVKLADDIHKIHKKVSTYAYTVLGVAPHAVSTLSPDIKSALPSSVVAGMSIIAVIGITNNLVKLQRTKGDAQS